MEPVLIIAKTLLTDKRISRTARLVLAQLLDHRNKRTGQCNPRRATLARELGVSVRTIQRALNDLRRDKRITSTRAQYTCFYEIHMCQNGGRAPDPEVPNRRSRSDQNGTSVAPYPLYEPIEGEPTRVRPLKRAAAGSPRTQQPSANAATTVGFCRKPPEREMDPYEMYYAAVANSMETRGRLLTASEERQVGNLMMYQIMRQTDEENRRARGGR